MELKINLDTSNDKMLIKVEEIAELTRQLGRAIRDLEILQGQKLSATVVTNDDAE